MAFPVEDRLRRQLAERAARGLLRRLTHAEDLVDFSSNDYLGLARSAQLEAAVHAAWEAYRQAHGGVGGVGSTGSRLLTGNSHLAEALERELAAFHDTEAALLFNSGYDANYGLLSCIAAKEDVVLYDALVHASVHDGMRASLGRAAPFAHNDVADLRRQLAAVRASDTARDVFVVVETIYSMDGDEAPLAVLADLCGEYRAHLIVDEAHATGVVGPRGAGCVQALGLQRRVFARVHTFGKALGAHGAVVVGSAVLRTYLINYARSLIFTTSLPPHSLVAVRAAYAVMAAADERRAKLRALIEQFQQGLRDLPPGAVLPSPSAIQGVILPGALAVGFAGNDRVVHFANALRRRGFDIKPIRSPTVPASTERVRICLHAHNTAEDVARLCAAIRAYWQEHVASRFDIALARL